MPSQECGVADFADISIEQHVIAALSEDIGQGDATTEALIAADASGKAQIIAREALVLAGVALAEAVFSELDNEASIDGHFEDGEKVQSGDCLLTVTAGLRALLTGERTALNFLQRLSGVATQSARYAEAVSGTGVLILDTRKTTPGWRMLEKYAVQCGGSRNHRRGLDDMILIKDNHLAALTGKCRIAEAVHRARRASSDLKIEVEAETLEQAEQATEAGADRERWKFLRTEPETDLLAIPGGFLLGGFFQPGDAGFLIPGDLDRGEVVAIFDGATAAEAEGPFPWFNLEFVALGEGDGQFSLSGVLLHLDRGRLGVGEPGHHDGKVAFQAHRLLEFEGDLHFSSQFDLVTVLGGLDDDGLLLFRGDREGELLREARPGEFGIPVSNRPGNGSRSGGLLRLACLAYNRHESLPIGRFRGAVNHQGGRVPARWQDDEGTTHPRGKSCH